MKPWSAPTILLAAAALAAAAPSAFADSSGKWKSSQETYDKVCAYCHEANVGPVLTGRKLPPEYVRAIVRSGNRAMPAFRPTEIDDEILAGELAISPGDLASLRARGIVADRPIV